MPIQRGDFVRPNNHLRLPQDSVWRVICSAGALKLEPENAVAVRVERSAFVGFRFAAQYFDQVVLCRGQWVAANEGDFMRDTFDPSLAFAMSPFERSQNFQNLPKTTTTAIANAVDPWAVAVDVADSMVVSAAQKLADAKEQARKQREVAAQKAKEQAKADKEAAAKAKAEEAKRQLSARLLADRCLGQATLALITEVYRLNNDGAEQMAPPSIAAHVDQLQPLAKSYGYRIVKPSLLAQVVKI